MRAVADRQRHQPVPRRVELDLVDAVAEAVVAPELWKVAIGVARQLGDASARNGFAGLGQKSVGPGDLLAAGDLGQQAIAGEGVVAGERRRLVHHLVRGVVVRRQGRKPG